MIMDSNKSEVAHILWSIQRNCEAMAKVMNDSGFSSRHEVIKKRYSALEKRESQLAECIGDDQASTLTCEIYTNIMEAQE